MIPRYLANVMAELPYRLRDEVEGYVNAVDTAAVDIARERGIRLTGEVRDSFLFLVGIRRLWSTINSSHWTAANSAEIFQRAEVPSVRAGSLFVGPRRRIQSGATATPRSVPGSTRGARVGCSCGFESCVGSDGLADRKD